MQQKWLAKLMGLDYEICYNKGKENLVADALYRLTEGGQGELNEIVTLQQLWLTENIDSYENDANAQNIIEEISIGDDKFKQYQINKGLIEMEGKLFVGCT